MSASSASLSSASLFSFSDLPGGARCSGSLGSPGHLADHLPGYLPGVWHADELAGGQVHTVATGHPLLDAELPGGGWPLGALTELLQSPGAPSWSLLLPALAAHWQGGNESVTLVCPPHEPFIPALAAAGLPARAIVWIRADTSTSSLWAAEQALQCADVGAVVAWLPGAQPVGLRRLQAAAVRRAGSLLFVLRPEGAALAASPARVRVVVRGLSGRGDPAGAEGTEGAALTPRMQVRILKRRGPPMMKPLVLQAHGERMQALLAAQQASPYEAGSQTAAVLPFGVQPAEPVTAEDPFSSSLSYALDRLAVAA